MFFELEPVFNNEGFSINIDYPLDLSSEELSGGHPFAEPVRVTGSIANRAGIVSIDASAVFTLSIPCDRCAEPLEMPMNIPVRHVLVTHLNDEENDELIKIDELRFNLDPLVTEDIFLNLPAKFLCDDDCKGICPVCGQNLNRAKCSCEKPIDPRLEALKQLLD